MKALFGLFIICLAIFLFGTALYGAVLAFKASIILGIVALIIEPSPIVLGMIAVFGHPEVAQKIATWLHLPF